jgi:hypothetical protein
MYSHSLERSVGKARRWSTDVPKLHGRAQGQPFPDGDAAPGESFRALKQTFVSYASEDPANFGYHSLTALKSERR